MPATTLNLLTLLAIMSGVAVATIILIAVGFVRTFRRERRTSGEGICPRCGYDRSGLNGGPCPECGIDADSLREARSSDRRRLVSLDAVLVWATLACVLAAIALVFMLGNR